MEYNILDKEKLIVELREIHKKLVSLYEDMFSYKYDNDEEFKVYIDNEYSQNSISKKDQKSWNQNFCHRASYTLLNKILFVRICEDKGFMRNPEDYIADEISNPHIGEKLSKVGLQKWTSVINNSTFGELINFAFQDMKKSYKNISLYKDVKYEILNPTNEELDLKYLDGNKKIKEYIFKFEKIIGDILEKLDTERFDFVKTDSNILGDVYEEFMDRETRKAIGQFYTPEIIIEYILKNTVMKTDVIENPFVTVADISCGSGHFLIMAYEILREKFINNLEELRTRYSKETYIIKKNGEEIEITGRKYWVEENIHYHLLKHCIYGADIDSFAVQLTTINLLLKDLDNFTDELNIIECDSLIKWEKDYEWKKLEEELDEEYETITFKERNLFGEEIKTEKTIRKENYNLEYIDISGIEKKEVVNYEKAKEIIKICKFWDGNFDYILGNPPYIGIKALNSNYKEYFAENYYISKRQFDIYGIFYERAILKSNINVGYITPKPLLNNENLQLLREFINKNTNINSISDVGMIFDDANVETCILILDKEIKPDNKIEINKINKENKIENIDKVEQSIFKKLPFSIFNIYMNEKNYNIYSKIMENADYKLEDILNITRGIECGKRDKSIISNYKGENRLIFGEDLQRNSIDIYDRSINFEEENTTKFKNKELYEGEKILIRRVGDRLISTAYEEKLYALNTIYIGKLSIDYSIYLLSLTINSKILNYWFKLAFMNDDKLFPYVRTSQLKLLPIKLIDETNKIDSKNIKEIIDINNICDEREEILSIEDYIDKEDNNLKKQIRKETILKEFEREICKAYGINENDIEVINNSKLFTEKINLNKENKNIEELLKILPINEFLEAYKENNKSFFKMSKRYNLTIEDIGKLRSYYVEEYPSINKLRFYDIEPLVNNIYFKVSNDIIDILREYKEYIQIEKLLTKLDKKTYDMFNIVRYDDINKSNIGILREVINSRSHTWNAYRKAKDKDRINKTFIKYYDSNYYGLSEWSDGIHKHYFLDAIEEYTETDPNEKKAKDILKLFKDLDIEDKKDYLSVIEGKINRVFK